MTAALIAAAAALFAVMPYVIVRGELRRSYARHDIAFWTVALTAVGIFRIVPLEVTPGVVLALFLVARLIILFAFLLRHVESGDVRWSPNVAAVLAAAIYAVVALHGLQWPVDGDEPFYALVTESMVRDRDVDLRNQYAAPGASVARRPDLVPQFGDPVGPAGEQYSRHEPFLAILMIPGYIGGGIHGSVLTIVLFGALFVRAVVLLLEEEGFSQRTILAVLPLVAFAPPVMTYAARIWPEVPAAYFLTEALRAAKRGRVGMLFASLAALGLLKLRFLTVSITFAVAWLVRERRWRIALVAVPVFAVPFAIAWWIAGHPLNVHSAGELTVQTPAAYARGAFGLLLDAQSGLFFQAPALFVALFALFHPRMATASFRLGAVAAAPYLLLLAPRAEWHGGWSPPLRYLVVFAPVLALGAATLFERFAVRRPFLWAGAASAAIAVHAIAFPWRLFHTANGESVAGEWLSMRWGADVSRILPSFIRPNAAAWVASILLVTALVLLGVAIRREWRWPLPAPLAGALFALLLAGGAVAARQPGAVAHLEDAHVRHLGGELYPARYTVARFLYTGGWRLRSGEAVEFLHAGGEAVLHYHAHGPVTVRIAGRDYTLPATDDRFKAAEVQLGARGLQRIECVAGETILDKIAVR